MNGLPVKYTQMLCSDLMKFHEVSSGSNLNLRV
jgi:hypothetical protein